MTILISFFGLVIGGLAFPEPVIVITVPCAFTVMFIADIKNDPKCFLQHDHDNMGQTSFKLC